MIRIVGAGMAGLLAASMLRAHDVEIFESKMTVPNNHHALLRFRSNAVADATGIPFRKVQVLKAIDSTPSDMPMQSPVQSAIAYSMKVLGRPAIRSIALADGGIETRYIAPPDFIMRLANSLRCKINFNYHTQPTFFSRRLGEIPPVTISTIPMAALADLLQYDWGREPPLFQSRNGKVIKTNLAPRFDVYATLYFPHPAFPPYRASITGNQLIIELMADHDVNEKKIVRQVLNAFGFPEPLNLIVDLDAVKVTLQSFAKIDEIDDEQRKRFILWATEKHNVYSLGRFATWRPGLLLDDVVNDVRVIQRLITKKYGAYDHALK